MANAKKHLIISIYLSLFLYSILIGQFNSPYTHPSFILLLFSYLIHFHICPSIFISFSQKSFQRWWNTCLAFTSSPAPQEAFSGESSKYPVAVYTLLKELRTQTPEGGWAAVR